MFFGDRRAGNGFLRQIDVEVIVAGGGHHPAERVTPGNLVCGQGRDVDLGGEEAGAFRVVLEERDEPFA